MLCVAGKSAMCYGLTVRLCMQVRRHWRWTVLCSLRLDLVRAELCGQQRGIMRHHPETRDWTMSGSGQIPRPEYPRPQLVRSEWLNLNGEWEFEIDHGRSGRERGLPTAERLAGAIVVPFCPESRLSGVGYKDFMAAVWYRRDFKVSATWQGRRILLHFGAVDYSTQVWVNGKAVGQHRGGYTPFSFDITALVRDGINSLVVCAEDDVRSGLQPRGKQSGTYHSRGCDYTRTTGIWQTVWLECVPRTHISSVKLIPDPENARLHLEVRVQGDAAACTAVAEASYQGKPVGKASARVAGAGARFSLPISEIYLWGPGTPHLYDLNLTLVIDGQATDEVKSYFGMRTVSLGEGAILINGKPVFQRLVLDQGFYPDGVYTAPSDDDLRRDIEISMGLGFNGARLHQKVFEPRYLYWADKLGYLTWGEYGNWGLDITTPRGLEQFLPEWLEAVERDLSHPSIIGWCPFNETWDRNGTRQDDEVLRQVYLVTKLLDPTRPVIDTSGNYHVVTDVYDVHDYDQNVDTFRARYEPMKTGGPAWPGHWPDRQQYGGQPYFVSEYGGTWWNPGQTDESSWGYGERPRSEGEFLARYEGLTRTLLENPGICAFCYTQLYDIEQEVNGLYTYDRRAKVDPELIRRVNTLPAAIERRP